MPVVTLPDGSQRRFDQPVSVHDVAADIGPGLAKATLAGKVDGRPIAVYASDFTVLGGSIGTQHGLVNRLIVTMPNIVVIV